MKKSLSLSFMDNESKKLKFCSSDNDIIFFDDLYKRGILFQPNKIYQVDFNIYVKKLGNYEVIINCLDMKNKEIFKTWIIRARVGKLNIIERLNITYIINMSNDVKTSFEFTNPLNNFAIINFICSTKTVIEIPINQVHFEANEKKNIIINIRKILIPQEITAYIFIVDENNFFHHVIEVKIKYI